MEVFHRFIKGMISFQWNGLRVLHIQTHFVHFNEHVVCGFMWRLHKRLLLTMEVHETWRDWIMFCDASASWFFCSSCFHKALSCFWSRAAASRNWAASLRYFSASDWLYELVLVNSLTSSWRLCISKCNRLFLFSESSHLCCRWSANFFNSS